MAPKTNTTPAKLANVLSYIRNSRTVHNIKDLEKALASVASINGMQVKDYLQALSDENQIRVEKIGSGNWYWSFVSEEKRSIEGVLEKTRAEWDRARIAVEEVRERLEKAKAERAEEEEDMLDDNTGDGRDELMEAKTALEIKIDMLKKELHAYSDNDPTELERKKNKATRLKAEAERWTDEVASLEGWFREQGVDGDAMNNMRMEQYGDDFDEEEGGLRELV
ncbi:hypothetical protein LTR50_005582 [Elasticomyces elasticus]|nr:hypothetical protein LTR50_005582 [Elasticomyces elasticus]